MLDREQLQAFEAVVEAQSFERAALNLCISRSAVSHRIRQLETALGQFVLVRETPIRPTAAGEVLMRHVRSLRMLEATTLREIHPAGAPQGPTPLAIAVNADSLATWFRSLMLPLIQELPIALEVILDDQDHTFERLTRGEVIGCLSSEPDTAPGYVADPLGSMVYRCVASPVFARHHFASGFQLTSVLAAPAVLFNRKDGLHDSFLRSVLGFAVERYARHYIPSPGALLEAIQGGAGYGLVPQLQIEVLLRSGALLDLTPGSSISVDLYWHRSHTESPLSAGVTRAVLARARQALVQRAVAHA